MWYKLPTTFLLLETTSHYCWFSSSFWTDSNFYVFSQLFRLRTLINISYSVGPAGDEFVQLLLKVKQKVFMSPFCFLDWQVCFVLSNPEKCCPGVCSFVWFLTRNTCLISFVHSVFFFSFGFKFRCLAVPWSCKMVPYWIHGEGLCV